MAVYPPHRARDFIERIAEPRDLYLRVLGPEWPRHMSPRERAMINDYAWRGVGVSKIYLMAK